MEKFSVRILGVAGGAAPVYEGLCSSSFLVLKNDQPFCLVDLGLGVARALSGYGYLIPDKVIITHNHTDHSGELPVVLRVETGRQRMLQIYSAEPVARRLQQHRMAEHAELFNPTQLAHWISPRPAQSVPLSDDLSLVFHPARHSECCYGFVIYRRESNGRIPLLGYSGDSGYCTDLYDKISSCRLAIYDAREKGNQWHAGVDEVEPWLGENGYIIGHGREDLAVSESSRLLYPGQVIEIEY